MATKLDARLKKIAAMSTAERITDARSKANELFERCRELERIHANNRYLIYGDPFGGALANTYAGNAYVSLRNANFGFELMRLAALWDGASADRISIPEVIALILDKDVLAQLKREFDGWYATHGGILRGVHNDRRWMRALRVAFGLGGAIMGNDRIRSIRRHRDKFLAHNLIPPAGKSPRFGYERKLRLSTHGVTNALTTLLEDRGLDYGHSRELCRRHASEFWDGLSWVPTPKS